MNKPQYHTFGYFVKNLRTVISLVLVWRGVWYVLDAIDTAVFGGYHGWTGFLGVVIGVALMYIPDHDLKEIDKL